MIGADLNDRTVEQWNLGDSLPIEIGPGRGAEIVEVVLLTVAGDGGVAWDDRWVAE